MPVIPTLWRCRSVRQAAANPFCVFESRSLIYSSGAELPDFLVYQLRDYVRVIGLLPDRQIVMIHEDRKVGGWQCEAAAGDILPDENPDQAAVREFNEETGWQAGSVFYLGPYCSDTNRAASLNHPGQPWTGHLYAATDLTVSTPDRSPDEIIETIIIDFDVALDCALHPPKPVAGIGSPILNGGTQILLLKIAQVINF